MNTKERIKSLEKEYRYLKSRYYREGARLDRMIEKGLNAGNFKYDIQYNITTTVLTAMQKAQSKLLQAKMAHKTKKEQQRIRTQAKKEAYAEYLARKRRGGWVPEI